MSNSSKRTLGPAAFESYMGFADSLKDGTNNDAIDIFKYNMAVQQGYIRPKKARLESAEALTAEKVKDAIGNMFGAFMPLFDEQEQKIAGDVLGMFSNAFAERCPGGECVEDENDGDECDGDECDATPAGTPANDSDDEAPEDGAPEDDGKDGKCDGDECPAQTECGDANSATPQEEAVNATDPSTEPDDPKFWMAIGQFVRDRREITQDELDRICTRFKPCGSIEEYRKLIDSLCCDDVEKKKGDAGKCDAGQCDTGKDSPKLEGVGETVPGFGDDDSEFGLGDIDERPLDERFDDIAYSFGDESGTSMASDVSARYGDEDDGVDYDALADSLLREHGFDSLTTDKFNNSGIR